MDYSQKYIDNIYQKAMIKRSQAEKEFVQRSQEEMEKNFWQYLGMRMEKLLGDVMKLYQTRGVSKQQIDTAEKEVGEFFTLVQTHTLPEVIDQLTMDLAKEKMIIKMEKQ